MPSKQARARATSAEALADAAAVNITNVQDLSDELLLAILSRLHWRERLNCEIVCKHWRGLLIAPSAMWGSLSLKLSDSDNGAIPPARMLFLRRRLPAIRQLEVSTSGDPRLDCSLITLLAGGEVLAHLAIDCRMSMRGLSLCCMLSQITCLDLNRIETPVSAADMNAAIFGLSSLRTLDWGFNGALMHNNPEAQPCELPTTLLLATRLRALGLCVARSGRVFSFGSIPAEVFSRLSGLTSLGFDSCGVTGIPACISVLTQLKVLTLLSGEGRAPALDLPEQLGGCQELTLLQLSTSTGVPAAIYTLTQLRILLLDQSRPTAAQLQNVSQLRSLRVLRLCRSPGHLGPVIGSLSVPSSLSSLTLDRNELGSMPNLPWLPALQVLNLQYNRQAKRSAAMQVLAVAS